MRTQLVIATDQAPAWYMPIASERKWEEGERRNARTRAEGEAGVIRQDRRQLIQLANGAGLAQESDASREHRSGKERCVAVRGRPTLPDFFFSSVSKT